MSGTSRECPAETALSRRSFLSRSAYGIGATALGSLLNPNLLRAAEAPVSGGVIQNFDFPRKARRVIHLCMAGGPSHLETFDFKLKLRELDGKPFPESFTKGQQLAQLQGATLRARGSCFDFSRCGESGQEISDVLPHIQSIADEICIVRSMHTEQINHDPAHAFMNTGSIIKGQAEHGFMVALRVGF